MSTETTTKKPQDTEVHPTKLVVKGDVLETSADFLTAAPMQVEWSQKWISRSERYYYAIFENVTQGGDKGCLFINEKALKEFQHNPCKDGKYTFVVDEEYQYGQASGAKDRFLVFHNKNNTIYQHRFVKSMWVNLGHKLGEIASDVGPGAVKNLGPAIEKQMLNMFGDPLRSF